MRKSRARWTLLLLLCSCALAPQARLKSREESAGRRLYRVSMTDERTGARRVGFIDAAGKPVIDFGRLPETAVYVGEFSEGRAVIDLKGGAGAGPGRQSKPSVGYIDETGRVRIEPRFHRARDFSEGLAYVEREGFRGFIDARGKELFKVEDALARDFHEGLAAVASGTPRAKWGFVDRAGKLAIARQYDFADDFSEGLAGVEVGGRYGFINKQGETVIAPRFEPRKGTEALVTVPTSRFSEGLACVKLPGSGYGYIDKAGEFRIAPQFARAGDFSEGLAWVVASDGKAGWIDKAGRWAVEAPPGSSLAYPADEAERSFSEGLVPFPAHSGGKDLHGYLNRRGEVVIPPREIYKPGPFKGGLARVAFYEKSEYRKGKTGHFDNKTGEFFEEKLGYIDKTGRFVWRAR